MLILRLPRSHHFHLQRWQRQPLASHCGCCGKYNNWHWPTLLILSGPHEAGSKWWQLMIKQHTLSHSVATPWAAYHAHLVAVPVLPASAPMQTSMHFASALGTANHIGTKQDSTPPMCRLRADAVNVVTWSRPGAMSTSTCRREEPPIFWSHYHTAVN